MVAPARAVHGIARDHGTTVAEVRRTAQALGAHRIYDIVFEGILPRYRDRAAERVGSVRRLADDIEGMARRAMWGHSWFGRE